VSYTILVVELRIVSKIAEIDRQTWNDLVAEGPPYLRWEFLDALEETGCVRPARGWAPAHQCLFDEGQLLAAAPAYVKGNSEGEFVFDHSWAQFSDDRLHSQYYPKLIVACPFTPATGPRLLLAEGANRDATFKAFVGGLRRFCEEAGLSSAHVLFPQEAQAKSFQGAGMVLRYGMQYHWYNPGYSSFDDFLARYSSKRRNQIRRERRALQEQDISLEVLLGSDLRPEQIDHVYEFYRSTVNKYFWGRQYLNRDFFVEICSRLGDHVLVVFAKLRGVSRPVAGAFNLLGSDALYGRYWGAREEIKHLHFNVCYYAGIEECIRRGLRVFEPGAGGEHKVARGFEPTITYSAHHLRHPMLDAAVRDYLGRERLAVEREMELQPCLLKPPATKPSQGP
jgi:hypothetical protein